MFEDDELNNSMFNDETNNENNGNNENNELTNLMKNMKSKCNFCNKEVKMFPAQSVNGELKFCDLVCAKLYYDNNKHFNFDARKYNNYYNENELSKKAKEIYDKCRFVLFEQLPIYQPLPNDPAFNNPELMRKIYNKILTPVLFKSIGAYE